VLHPDRDEYLARVEQGRVILERSDRRGLEEAEAMLRGATRLVPGEALAFFWLGRVHYRRAHEIAGQSEQPDVEREWAACAGALGRAFALDPGFSPGPPGDEAASFALDLELARCHAGNGAHEAAIDHLKRILTRGITGDGRIHFLLAETHMALGRVEEAIEWFLEARTLRAAHDAEVNFALAVAYDRDEQVARAAEHLDLALRRDPRLNSLGLQGKVFVPAEDEDYYHGLARRGADDPAWAVYHFRRYLSVAPEHGPWVHRARAHLEAARADLEPGAGIAVKGNATVDQKAAAAVVARAEPALRECLAPVPGLLLRVEITQVAGILGAHADPTAGGARPGTRVVTMQAFGGPADAHRSAIECVERTAATLKLPKPTRGSGSPPHHATIEFMLIAR
jgi:tetratricopeptide (TPR) repeat protein